MKSQILNYFLSSAFLIFLSCKQERKFNYHDFASKDKEIISKNHVMKSIETKIIYDSIGDVILKRIEKISFFNSNGLCEKEIIPRYEVKSSRIDYINLPVETSTFLGFNDTIYYEFNNQGQLTKSKESTYDNNGKIYLQINELTYNKNGDVISDCTQAENYEIQCIYSNYVYGNDKQIISRKDSADFKIEWDLSKPFKVSHRASTFCSL